MSDYLIPQCPKCDHEMTETGRGYYEDNTVEYNFGCDTCDHEVTIEMPREVQQTQKPIVEPRAKHVRHIMLNHTVQLNGLNHTLENLHTAVETFKRVNYEIIVDSVIFQTNNNAETGSIVISYHYKRKFNLVRILKHVKRPPAPKTLSGT